MFIKQKMILSWKNSAINTKALVFSYLPLIAWIFLLFYPIITIFKNPQFNNYPMNALIVF